MVGNRARGTGKKMNWPNRRYEKAKESRNVLYRIHRRQQSGID